MSTEHFSIKEAQAEAEKILPPEYLRYLVPWRDEPESEQLPFTESAFEGGKIKEQFEALIKTREAIRAENERRGQEGLPVVSFVGIHAASRGDAVSALLLERILDTSERLGVEKSIHEITDERGNSDNQRIAEIVEHIRRADGFVLTTHTKRGMLSSPCTALFEVLEKENFAGKVVGFSHTFGDTEKDSQIGPPQLAHRFFEEKGCVILPYSFMYAHQGEANEQWLERDIERNGVNFVKAIERLSKSELPDFLQDPSVFNRRKIEGGAISPQWEALHEKVRMINAEREKKHDAPLNVLFVWGGENPKGYSARAATVLEKNFNFLGLATDTIRLAEENEGIKTTSGNPEIPLPEVLEVSEQKDAAMRTAYEKLMKADVVIFASPVRWFDVSSRLQKFIERMTPLEISGFLLEGKAFGTVITFAEAGATEAESRLQQFAHHNGLMNIPLGGLKISLTSNPKGKEAPTNKDFITTSRRQSIRRMAAMGTAVVVDFLAADGKDVKRIRWDHLNPLLTITDPED